MADLLKEIKPRNARSARAVARKAPQLQENPKRTLFLRSTSTSATVNAVARDLFSLKKTLSTRFVKKNAVHPFEDPTSLEFFSQKNDTSLICFSSHSKKRPHCLTFVRNFDGKLLDMLEFLVVPDTLRTLEQFSGRKAQLGAKPLLSFSGTPFDDAYGSSGSGTKFALAKSLLIDFFRGEDTRQVDLAGLQYHISFTASESDVAAGETRAVIHMRTWRIITSRSGQKLPRVSLEEIGPRADFVLGRMQEASPEAWRNAMRVPKALEKSKPKKNIDVDRMGDKLGRVHVGRQDLERLQTRKLKGLKRKPDLEEQDGGEKGQNDEDSDHMNGDDIGGVALPTSRSKRPKR